MINLKHYTNLVDMLSKETDCPADGQEKFASELRTKLRKDKAAFAVLYCNAERWMVVGERSIPEPETTKVIDSLGQILTPVAYCPMTDD